jgi:hypothetical protein
MSERATVFQSTQIGVETVPGTAVDADRRLNASGFNPVPQTALTPFRPMGSKFNTVDVRGKEHTELDLTGVLSYNDLLYHLAGCLCEPVTDQPTQNGVWTLDFDLPATGQITLEFEGEETDPIDATASAAVVQAALVALSTVGAGNVVVTGTSGLYTVTFQNVLEQTASELSFGMEGFTTYPTLDSTAAVDAFRHVFTPQNYGPDTIKTYTVEVGSSAGAERTTYGILDGLELALSADSAAVSGNMIAQELEEGITLTADPTYIDEQPVDPRDIRVMLGDSIPGMAKLDRCQSANFSVSDRFSAQMTLDDEEASFTAHVERGPSVTAEFIVMHNADSADLMTDLRAKTRKYARIQARGPEIETGFNRMIQITFPCTLISSDRGDQNDVYASTYGSDIKYDQVLEKAVEIVIWNDLATL